jgi:hypothetical protein
MTTGAGKSETPPHGRHGPRSRLVGIASNEKRPLPRFCLCFPKVRNRQNPLRFPSAIRRCGTTALRYAEALAHLSDAGSQEARYAMSLLTKQATTYQRCSIKALRKAMDREEFAPVELAASARWKLDRPGLVALQILLCLWQASHTLDEKNPYSICAYHVEPFHDDSAEAWWCFAHMMFTDSYRHPERVPGLISCVKPPSCRDSPIKSRNYIIRKVRERFLSFAPPAPGYRI